MKLSKYQKGLLEYLLTEKLFLSEVRQATFEVLANRHKLIVKALDNRDMWQVILTPLGREIATKLAEETRLKDEAFWSAIATEDTDDELRHYAIGDKS